MEDFVFPQWLEQYRLDDNLRAKAFENADVKHKGRIKTAIAIHFAKEKEVHNSLYKIEKNAFLFEKNISPCDVTLFYVDEDFSSPALFISALMPALFAKSPLGVIFRKEPSQNILLALELLGLEHVFLFKKEEEKEYSVERLVLQLSKLYQSFTLALLSDTDEFENLIAQEGIKVCKFSKKIRLLIDKKDEEEMLAYTAAYPHAQIYTSYLEMPAHAFVDIVSAQCENIDKIRRDTLVLGKDCEFYFPLLFAIEDFLSIQESIAYFEENMGCENE